MVEKIRVHELAKELDLPSDELLAVLKAEGIEVTSHLSGIDADIADLIRDQMKEAKEAKAVKAKKSARKSTVDVAPEPAAEAEAEIDVEAEKVPKVAGAKPKEKKPVKKGGKSEAPAQRVVQLSASGSREIHLKPPVVVRDLADAMGVRPNALITELMADGIFAAINEAIEAAVIESLCAKHGFVYVPEKRGKGGITKDADMTAPEQVEYADAEVNTRPPVVTFLGHVDHGKTSLLDSIRKSDVVSGEAGGITQHIGASMVEWNGHKITFLDTPGHEAFTAMRARGASTTDIVVLIVAADDGFMPQTVEALSHARAAGVPIIIAANKMDLPGADYDKILLQMQQNSLTAEDWGGDIGVVKVSAHTGLGIEQLLERIVLETELLELKANAELPVRAVVIESQLEQGFGPTVNILVKNGTIHTGDIVICGGNYGKVKALIDGTGSRIKEAGPSMACKVVGLSGLPPCGTVMAGCEDEKAGPPARRVAPTGRAPGSPAVDPARQPRRSFPADRGREPQRPRGDRQGRRAGDCRSGRRLAQQAQHGEDPGQRHPHRRRRNYGQRRAAGGRLGCDHRRLPCAGQSRRQQAGPRGRRRSPLV